jgi:prepilin peptidase CpaA
LREIPFLVLEIASLIVVSIAVVCDIRSHKIPNKLTFPASFIGIILQSIYFASWSNGRDLPLFLVAGALTAVLGWFAGVLVMGLTKFFLRQFGHGDTKLVAAVGTFMGPWLVPVIYLYYGLCFGIFSFVKLALVIPWGQLYVQAEMKKAGLTPPALNLEKLSQTRKELIPVAPFIALGTLCCVLFEKPTLEFLGFH